MVFYPRVFRLFSSAIWTFKLIMNMITSTRYHIQWNGAPLSKVRPSRGVHQGDPLSPYLFIHYLEHLSRLLEEVVWDKKIHPIGFRGQIRISHLFFANDIFLFTKAKVNACQNLWSILHTFCNASSQIISTHKSRIWFSPTTPRRTKTLISSIFDVPTMT